MVATVAGIHLGIDTHANRPAGNTVPDGSIYSCSTHGLIYKSNYAGNSWATFATLGGTLTYGAAGDIGVETFGASAAAGAVGKVADAGHIHQMPASPGGGSTSPLVQCVGRIDPGSTASFTLVLPAAPTSGNLLVLCVGTDNYDVNTVTQTNVVWTAVDSARYGSGNLNGASLWYGVASGSASASCAITIKTTASTVSCLLAEFKGLTTLDQHSLVQLANGTAHSISGTITPVHSGGVAVEFGWSRSGPMIDASGPFTRMTSHEYSNANMLGFQFGWCVVANTTDALRAAGHHATNANLDNTQLFIANFY